MSNDVKVHEVPTAVSVKSVLKLIQAHTQKDEYKFKEAAMEIARELELNGKEELYLYIYAMFGMVNTFEVTD
jgi:hypothetical protein